MGNRTELTPDNSDEESGDAFTDGDFDDSDEGPVVERPDDVKSGQLPVNEASNPSAVVVEVPQPSNGETVEVPQPTNGETVEVPQPTNGEAVEVVDNTVDESVTVLYPAGDVTEVEEVVKEANDDGLETSYAEDYVEHDVMDRKDSQGEISPSIVGILGDQHTHVRKVKWHIIKRLIRYDNKTP